MNDKLSLLSTVNGPADLKRMPAEKLPELAEEIREIITKTVTKNGGHLASNLGIVELTIALHRVYDSPRDTLIWDVGHQCYTHKLLTGRQDRFATLRKANGISGFPKPSESIHDSVETGHSSTSLSVALGVAMARDIKKNTGLGKVVAVIGDGALTAGQAFEALNHIGGLQKDIVVIFNDNKMSIDPNVGAMTRHGITSFFSTCVSILTTTRSYQNLRDRIDRRLVKFPLLGFNLLKMVIRLKKGIKALFFKNNFFSELGFEYVGPIDGHSITTLIKVLDARKKLNRPVVIHVVTQKGKGYNPAEKNPHNYHGVSPAKDEYTGLDNEKSITFTTALGRILLDLALKNDNFCAITAAMCGGVGFREFATQYPKRFFDVGIAEQHALTFAAGLAREGVIPIVAIYSTFIQRAVDQFVHDLALPALPALLILDRAGLVGADGETHQGVYDIALFRCVANTTFAAPACREELRMFVEQALINRTGPYIIRYPKAAAVSIAAMTAAPLETGRGCFLIKNNNRENLLVSLGALLVHCRDVVSELEKQNIHCDLYNLRFIRPLDQDFLIRQINGYKKIFFVEDGVKKGGLGEHLGQILRDNLPQTEFYSVGLPDIFIAHGEREQQLADFGLTGPKLRKFIADKIC